MPRRLPVRPAVIVGNMFVILVSWIIGIIYYAFVFLVWLPKAEDDWKVILLLSVFHVLFIMLLWSFVQAMTTDPGQVPVFWGFHLGDPENKRRRYCLMCNIFKPERCHHCSSCNRCVLNMDHHCPWINNCIGFWNRKFFILLLIYVLVVTYFVAIAMFSAWVTSIQWSLDAYYFSKGSKDETKLIANLVIQVAYMLNGIVGILMTMFLKFHINLALSNKTTIENLEMKGRPFQSQYDIGAKNNWEQVFGRNRLLWPFPIFADSGKPIGEGIYWKTLKSEEESRQNSARRQNQQSGASPDARNNNYVSGNSTSQNIAMAQLGRQGVGAPAQGQFANNSMPGASQALSPNQVYQQRQMEQQYMAQQYQMQQQQQMYQQHRNNLVDNKVYENQQRAAQLSEQINRQKAQIQQAKPKNARVGGTSQGGSSQGSAPPKRQKPGFAANPRLK